MNNIQNFRNYCQENFLNLKENFDVISNEMNFNKTSFNFASKRKEKVLMSESEMNNGLLEYKTRQSYNKDEKNDRSNKSSYVTKNSPLKHLESNNKFDKFSKNQDYLKKLNYVNESIKANLNKKMRILYSDDGLNDESYRDFEEHNLLGYKLNHIKVENHNQGQVPQESKDLAKESNYYNIKLLLYSKAENNSNNDDSLNYLYLPYNKDSIGSDSSYINLSKSYNHLNNNLNRNGDSYLNVNELSLNYTLINRFKTIKDNENTIDNIKNNKSTNVTKNIKCKSILKIKTQEESLNSQLKSTKINSQSECESNSLGVKINWKKDISQEKIFLFTDEPNANEITSEEYEFIQNSLINREAENQNTNENENANENRKTYIDKIGC